VICQRSTAKHRLTESYLAVGAMLIKMEFFRVNTVICRKSSH